MYEEYTDKQIVEMLVPKLKKAVPELNWDEYLNRPVAFSIWNRLISVIYKSGYIRGQLGRSFIIGEKKAEAPVSTFKVGDKVKFLGLSFEDEEAFNNRRFYPSVGTIGEVVEIGGIDFCFVQWPKGITSGNGTWTCPNCFLEKVTEHWVPATGIKLQTGDKVRLANKNFYRAPWFPKNGIVGMVIASNMYSTVVQWPEGSTGRDGRWNMSPEHLEVLLCE